MNDANDTNATLLSARTAIVVDDPATLTRTLCEHLADYDGVNHTQEESRHALMSPFGSAEMIVSHTQVAITVSARNLPFLLDMRSVIAHHVIEFAGDAVRIRWSGDGSQIRKPLNYRVLSVIEVSDLSPRMRRIRFSAENLATFATQAHIHVRLVFGDEAMIGKGPQIGENGLEQWPADQPRPESRAYTIRRVDAAAGTLDIDFVLHPEADGPGCRFAEQADIGQRIGMTGPGGASLPLDRDWYLIAGDETALPAIGRFMEMLPDSASGHVIIEISHDSERQDLSPPAGMSVHWVARGRGLVEAVRQHQPAADAQRPFVWVGCEQSRFRQLREYVRKTLCLPKGSHLIVAYWREGHRQAE